jgi:hypothetical protein
VNNAPAILKEQVVGLRGNVDLTISVYRIRRQEIEVSRISVLRLRLLLLEEIKAEQGRDFGRVMGEVYGDSSSLNRDVGKAWVEV